MSVEIITPQEMQRRSAAAKRARGESTQRERDAARLNLVQARKKRWSEEHRAAVMHRRAAVIDRKLRREAIRAEKLRAKQERKEMREKRRIERLRDEQARFARSRSPQGRKIPLDTVA